MRKGALAAIACLWAVCPVSLQAESAPRRPNIVFILSDDHAWQSISAYGGPQGRTPSIDRIAREGAKMTRMLSPNALCAPARAALLTGKLSHRNGIAINYDVFDGSQPTLQSRLQDAGYRTALFGKWHLKSDPTGFDNWEILDDLQGQGRYYNPNFKSPTGIRERRGYATRITTDLAMKWLETHASGDGPFLLLMWHKGPHRPFDPDVTAPSRPGRPQLPLPATFDDDYSGRPQAGYQRMEVGRDFNPRDLKLRYPAGADAEQKASWDEYFGSINARYRESRPLGKSAALWNQQRYMNDYMAAADAVDDSVGKMLDELDRRGLSDNTIVIYSSDQGFFLGEHGWFDKRWFYEESLRSPFMIRWPGHIEAGTTTDIPGSQIDVLPTLLEAAEVEGDGSIQGQSLLPTLKTGTAPKRDAVYLRYSECPGEHVVPCFYGMADDRYKLVYFHQFGIRSWELYDRVVDPQELRNLYDDPAYASVRSDLHARLAVLRAEMEDNDNPETMGTILQRTLITMMERCVKILRLGESLQ